MAGGGRFGGGARKEEDGAPDSATTAKINPLRVGARETLTQMGPACGKGNNATSFSRDGMRYYKSNPGFDWGDGADPPALGGVHDAVTTALIKEYAKYLEGQEHDKLLVPGLAHLLGAGGHGMVSGTQTKQDLKDETLHSRVDITKLIYLNHPGAANKDVRVLKTAAVQLVEDMAACMLANLADHITGPGANTLKTLRDRGERMHDPEYTRRRDTGCSIYLLNYLICCVLLDCPEARSEAVKRAADWHKLERRFGETAAAWEVRLVDQSTFRGDDEPLDSESDKLKLKYITGSRLTVPDPLVSAAYHLNVPEGGRVQEKPLDELRRWLSHMISEEVGRSKARGDDNDKRARDDADVASTKPTPKRLKDGGQGDMAPGTPTGKKAKKARVLELLKSGACFECGKQGHKKVDCPTPGAAPSRGAAPSQGDQHTKPDKPWAKPGAKGKPAASDAAVRPTFTRREKRAIAAFSATMVEQRGKPASEVQAVAANATATILGKAAKGKQGQPREVGDAGRAAQAKPSKAEQAYNRKMAEADDVEDEEDSD
jgi:hypothetical protein